jgi:hypothetical protein
MLKRLLGLVLSAFIACAGVAHAQSATSPSGTATTKPAAPMPMPMMSGMMPNSNSTDGITAGQVAAVGVGVVAGVVLFQGAMWHGMVVMGAVIGGYVGDYLYNLHEEKKAAS